ncbi:glycoside hydrolase family 3 C-terminal domain-containing protein [Paenibacillus albidus]|uniref:glycoside hydrolase family 3 C-terminal domain-containing protein n=1 Tax=Paenibacillus albidus TaxID=2041023 RepID=UPI001BE89F92|nr:glycoside hydrolase family 3 C-terminal domain-containing protein [Paenibacillus albidus]MBT2290164.1 glycoside hydrolase family 3 C-terminal domain-containing protein [Paenibacillus albidus]
MKINISGLVARMTLHEKVMLCTGENSWRTQAFEPLDIPSILMSDGSSGVRFQKDSDVTIPQSFYESISGRFDSEEAISHTHEATCFPSASTVACSWDTDLLQKIGEALGEECRHLGINLLLGPGMNIRRHPLTARNFEYYSEDPYLTGEMASALVMGVQSKGIGTSLKHFACHNSDTRRTRVNAIVDERALREIYLAAFERVIRKAKPTTVMSAYNKINGASASEDPFLLNQILREEWGFEGAVISDWGAVKNVVEATKAGLDLQMPLSLSSSLYLENAVKNGELPEEMLDRRVTRILELVFKLTESVVPTMEVDFARHHQLAQYAAESSIVLLKNERQLLPLTRDKVRKIAVIGRLATEPLYQGTGCAVVNAQQVDIPLDCLRNLCEGKIEVVYAPGYDMDGVAIPELLREAAQLAEEADAILVFAGANLPQESDDYNRKHMNIEPGHRQLIEEVCALNHDSVLILANGESLAMPWVDRAAAVLETWFGGEGMGEALAKIVLGHVNPSGKLPATIPIKLSHTPAYLTFQGNQPDMYYNEGIYAGYRYYDKKEIAPRFPFGHGLSYTRFTYSNLKLSTNTLTLPGNLKVFVDITNSGERYGKEIVQLYLSQPISRLPRPPKELKGFTKVGLNPGETRTVEFILEERDFSYYNPEFGEWVADSAEFIVRIGASSRKIRLSATVKVDNPRKYYSVIRTDSGFTELFENEAAKEIFYRFMVENGLIEENQVNEELDQLLLWSFWGLQSFMDMNSKGIITYEKMNEVVAKMNAALPKQSE